MTPAKLKEFRKSLNLTQPQFAERIGYSTSTVNYIETGKQKPSKNFRRAVRKFKLSLEAPHAPTSGSCGEQFNHMPKPTSTGIVAFEPADAKPKVEQKKEFSDLMAAVLIAIGFAAGFVTAMLSGLMVRV